MKIAVYAISKNEEQFVERFCNSAKDADLILIADTGSTDNTTERARSCGAQVFAISVQPWRFDLARNAALCLLPADVDICVSLDLDEVLEPCWRDEIQRVWQPTTTRLRYKYDWGHQLQFFAEKIHARAGYHWHHPVHEYPRADKRTTEQYACTEKLLITHHPDATKSRSQYLDLLRISVLEDPYCARNAFYFARELTFHNLWQEAVGALKNYLDLPTATFREERCYAMRLLAKAHNILQNEGEASHWFERAIAESPGTREPYVDLAMFFYAHQRWSSCLDAAERALGITERHLLYTCDPEAWSWKPFDLAALAAHHLFDTEKAMRYGQCAVDLAPKHEQPRLTANLAWYVGRHNLKAA